ncbi:muramoyltetrapeptide carboxypeptidase LdcA involved in peptidoglycan recycling [Streptohalobacillus salinus]|uniref:Muramoyltetrapeptide carboxypeptidase LdcA involved in peptidoglycan recycling n=1 Tax=Streptohalobacillus salinus TaxID=621096 RepID=A0A2V3WA73_9BACI|nr:LD-carboxypeptidase [Streptohalobacillus salinus]PXW90970.1 muramoyltetrapeptide carboxypeptidase LdcA involved in peptidoglycan recycling [Streptohalobacillus salinus]
MLNRGDTVAFVGLSNGRKESERGKVAKVVANLEDFGLTVKMSPHIFLANGQTAPAKVRAKHLEDVYQDEEIKAIFDVSGGDLANQVLPYFDFETCAQYRKPFFGYSDVTVFLNPARERMAHPVFLFQILMLAELTETERECIKEQLFGKGLVPLDYHSKALDQVSGELVGGNIRCLLKLAGTPYFPSLHNKVLLLESNSGDENRIATFFEQLNQLGAYQEINGLILGRFSELDQVNPKAVEQLIAPYLQEINTPLSRTFDVGHHAESKIVALGEAVTFTI